MSEKPRLDVLQFERLAKERIVEQINLSDREIVCRSPVGVHLAEFIGGESGFLGDRGGQRSILFEASRSAMSRVVPSSLVRDGAVSKSMVFHPPVNGPLVT